MLLEKGTIPKLEYGFLFAFRIAATFSRFGTIHVRDSQPPNQTLHNAIGRAYA